MPLRALAPGQILFHAVQLGRRAVKSPAVSQQGHGRGQQHPDRPELTVGAGGQPDDDADHEQREATAGLLEQPALEVTPARDELGALLRARGGELREVGQKLAKLLLGLRLIDGLDPVAQLILGQASAGEVLADLLRSAFALLV